MWAADNLQGTLYLLVCDCVSYRGSPSFAPSVVMVFGFCVAAVASRGRGARKACREEQLSVVALHVSSGAGEYLYVSQSTDGLKKSTSALNKPPSRLSSMRVIKTSFVIKRTTDLEDTECESN